MTNFVLQKNKEGLYSSELINGKYQILESQFVAGNYYIYNLEKDCIEYRDSDNGITLFNSIQSCLDKLNNVKTYTKKTSVFRKKTRNSVETAYSYMRYLLNTSGNTKSDQEIYDLIKQKYPDSKYSHHYVKYQRKLLIST